MTMEQISADFTIELFKKYKTYEDISDILRQRFPSSKGFSATSIKRFIRKIVYHPANQKDILEKLYQKL